MEVYATLTEHADHEVGRLVDALEELGELDNTLFFYIFGDNGGSIIGDLNGCLVEWSKLNDAPEDIPYLLSCLDDYGGPNSYPNYAVGWAMAGSTPCSWGITFAHAGGNIAGMVVHWPKGIAAKGEKRTQYHHVIDIVPTILEAVGIPAPQTVNGVPQLQMPGVSMQYSFKDANAPDHHITQYNETLGNRSIYHDGWLAAVVHTVNLREPANAHQRFCEGSMGAVQHARGLRTSHGPRREAPAEARVHEGALHSRKRSRTTCSRWTTARRSASIQLLPAARTSCLGARS